MISTYVNTIPAKGQWNLAARGNFIRCMESNGEVLRCSLDDGGGFEIEAGLSFETKLFENVIIENPTTKELRVKITISDEGTVTDNRLVGRLDLNGSVSVLSTLASRSTFNTHTVTSTAATEIAVYNNERQKMVIESDNECIINGGFKFTGAIEWETTEAVTLQATGADATVNVLELSR